MSKFKCIMLCMLVLVGCSKKTMNENDFHNTYNSFVDSILDNNGAESVDIPFRHKLDVQKISENEYHYTVTIDEPKIAMYHIQMMVVDRNMSGTYPFIGLLNNKDDHYSMIPHQENKNQNFVKGISLEGVSQTPSFTLNIQVSWKDYAQVNTYTAFFNYTYEYQENKQNQEQENEVEQE